MLAVGDDGTEGVMGSCDECTFTYADWAVDDIPEHIRTVAGEIQRTVIECATRRGGVEQLRAHPLPDTWSALEYTCHLRDVLQVQRDRLARALAEDKPIFEAMGRDERVVLDRYNEQDPAAVAADLLVAADALAAALEALDPAGWERVGVYGYPTVEERSMVWVAQHTLHELIHHRVDIDNVLGLDPG
jgi:S-DNA-T family DNA segregation ATPase FtsK/SpoIIIE